MSDINTDSSALQSKTLDDVSCNITSTPKSLGPLTNVHSTTWKTFELKPNLSYVKLTVSPTCNLKAVNFKDNWIVICCLFLNKTTLAILCAIVDDVVKGKSMSAKIVSSLSSVTKVDDVTIG